jgi:hypothetical protein
MSWAGWAGLACLAAAVVPNPAWALVIAPAPIPQRVALADVVVVGKVAGFGDKLVTAAGPFGAGNADYQVAVVQVGDAILGAKDAKEIKVGFVPPPEPGTGRPIVIGGPRFSLKLEQEVCLFLTKHPTEDFYVGRQYFDLIDKTDPNFDKQLDEVKRCAKLLADPAAGLKAKAADDRFLTAAMLVVRYRTPPPGAALPGKTEPIDAGESKQILQALAEADWGPAAGPAPIGLQLNPQNVFFRLNLTPQDGWTPPADATQFADEAKKWLKDNTEKYRIQRYVAEKKEGDDKKKDDK